MAKNTEAMLKAAHGPEARAKAVATLKRNRRAKARNQIKKAIAMDLPIVNLPNGNPEEFARYVVAAYRAWKGQ